MTIQEQVLKSYVNGNIEQAMEHIAAGAVTFSQLYQLYKPVASSFEMDLFVERLTE